MDLKPDQLSALTESQQHLVEVYTRRRYFRRWTKSEKIFGLAIIALLILFLTFFSLYLAWERCLNHGICTSKECLQSSTILLQTVNFSQNPCDDFYKFACGRFGKEYPLVHGNHHNSWFTEKEAILTRHIQRVLEEPDKSSDLNCVKGAKLLYQSCVNGHELNRLGLYPLFELLELVELPKTIPIYEEPEGFNLGRTLALSQRHLSQDILVTVGLEKVGDNNITAENTTVLKLSPGLTGLSVFRDWKYQRDTFTDVSELHASWIIENKFKWNDFKKLSPRKIVLATVTFITDIFREILIELDQSDDYNSTELVSTAYKIITFAAELDWKNESNKILAEVAGDEEEDCFMTLPELQAILDEESNTDSLSQKVDWKEYVSVLFENINVNYSFETDVVIVKNIEYFKFLCRTLGKAKPIAIQRHVWWKIVEEFGRYTTSTMRGIYGKYSRSSYEDGIGSSRTGACIFIVRMLMDIALSHQMAKKDNFSGATGGVRQMLKDIEYVFETAVKSTPWMDSATKKMILDKTESIRDEIGYPDWLFDERTVDAFHKGMDLASDASPILGLRNCRLIIKIFEEAYGLYGVVSKFFKAISLQNELKNTVDFFQFVRQLDLQKSEFLKNIIRIKEWEVEKILINIGPEKEVRNGTHVKWFSTPLQVNAYYSRIDNLIAVPPGILQSPFYFRGLPSLNYGAIGSILGHELIHGFDTEGRNYNKYGEKIAKPWPRKVNMEYENRAKCFVDQYEAYNLHEKHKLNGTITLAENIADNGGVRQTFRAYKLFKERHGAELKLPGFEKFTDEQLLFLSFANIWCEEGVPRPHLLGKDPHSPHRIRVLASLRNLKEFAEVYNCPSGSNMNPKHRCIIW